MMTKKELIRALADVPEDTLLVCQMEDGGWDNIQDILYDFDGTCIIVFGGGSPFSNE